MPYPPYLARITHFAFDALAGLESPSAVGTDAELNALIETQNQQNLFIRRITNSDGTLKNPSTATAQALAGTQEFVSTASQTLFVTTITYAAAFTNLNVMVYSGSTRFATSAVAVSDESGFLGVTIAAQPASTSITVFAFESGAGLLAKLQSFSTGLGASLLSIEDIGGYTVTVTTEAALQELYSHTQGVSGKSWLEGVLVMSGYLAKTGGTMTGNIAMSAGATVTGLPASASNGQAVRHEQVVALQTTITGISSQFMPKAGGTFTGAVNLGSQVLNGLVSPTTTDGAANKGYVDTTLASFGGLPVGSVIPFAAAAAPTGWLACDGSTISRTTYASLFSVIGVTWGAGDGVTTFGTPDLRGRAPIGTGAGAGLTSRTLAATGGEETHLLTLSETPAHTHTVYSGGYGANASSFPNDEGGLGTPVTAITSSSQGSDAVHNNMQPFVALTYIIKY
jgi:microcystin-dependent protein